MGDKGGKKGGERGGRRGERKERGGEREEREEGEGRTKMGWEMREMRREGRRRGKTDGRREGVVMGRGKEKVWRDEKERNEETNEKRKDGHPPLSTIIASLTSHPTALKLRTLGSYEYFLGSGLSDGSR